MSKQELPNSNDEYWIDADKHSVEIDKLKDLICRDHKLTVDIPKREAKCEVCGYGFRFKVEQVEMREGKLYDLVKERYLTN